MMASEAFADLGPTDTMTQLDLVRLAREVAAEAVIARDCAMLGLSHDRKRALAKLRRIRALIGEQL
jgi:hypothetical protein